MSGEPLTEFVPFPKLARLSRECVITEKLNGRNTALIVTDDFELLTASRTGFVTSEHDNYGFAGWAQKNREALIKALGPGRHFGEWWGAGVPESKRYRMKEKRFSLFNTTRWGSVEFPKDGITGVSLLYTTPVLYQGMFTTEAVEHALADLATNGSRAAPGCMDPEGVVIFHVASNTMFKKTLKGDAAKGFVA
jgi:hypothetical protein